jgi:anti-sigma factor RsiW
MTRVAELTLKSLDSALSEAETAELSALVDQDPAAEAEHLELLALEGELRGLLTEFDFADATLARIQAAQADRTADAVLAAIRDGAAPAWARPEPAPPPRGRRWVAFAAVVACTAAVVVAVWLGSGPAPTGVLPPDIPHAPQAYARLSLRAGFVEVLNPAGDLVAADEGCELPPGFTLRTGEDSHAVVDLLTDHARFEIESGTVVPWARR